MIIDGCGIVDITWYGDGQEFTMAVYELSLPAGGHMREDLKNPFQKRENYLCGLLHILCNK
jgi:hypothetical protein